MGNNKSKQHKKTKQNLKESSISIPNKPKQPVKQLSRVDKLIKEGSQRHSNYLILNGQGLSIQNMIGIFQKPIKIEVMDLTNNNIQKQGAQLIANKKWPYLTILFLNHNKLGDEGTKTISGTQFPDLTHLYLNSNDISDEGAAHLAKASWPKLNYLFLVGNKISQDGIKIIKNHWPNINVYN